MQIEAEPKRSRLSGAGVVTAGRMHMRRASELIAPFLFLLVVGAFLSIASENFLTVRNLLTILLQISVVGIIAVGQTMVMITAGIDLSVGGVVGLAGVVASLLVASLGVPIGLAMIAGTARSMGLEVVEG